MKINRNSWHYKLYMLFDRLDEANNLCAYFWGCVFNLVAVLCLAVLFCLLAIAFCITFFVNAGGINLLILFLCGGGAFIIPIIVLVKLRERNGYLPVYMSGEKVVWEFLKAKKQKICPIVHYED